ncbi:MAG TPA: MFS transporter [Dysgonomonas sp.]|nr:MFS transporter [Dysgonomonas sp.]
MNGKLSKSVLWLMAVTACMVVANNYYNQPLLGEICREFNITEDDANKAATITIFGYAMGLFLLVPLGDMFRKKKIIILDFFIIILSLLCFALSPSIEIMLISSFFIGLSSVVPQMMVPLAAQLSSPEERSKNIGIVMTGLLTGILGSRVLSGYIGLYWGWRSVFFLAAGIMLILWVLLFIYLPDVNPTFKGSYKNLIKSIADLIRKRPDLRIASVKGALSLASFQAFWTTLTFHVEQPPFLAQSDTAGLLGIVGIGGALSASFVGSIADKTDKNKLYFIAILLMLAAWIFFGFLGYTYVGLILGIFVLDVGLQSIHITNQSIIFSKDVNATNRLNTVYMTCYFLGGSLGAYAGGRLWAAMGWNGVVISGAVFVLILLFFQVISGYSCTDQK